MIKQLVPNAAGHNIQALATSSTEYHLPALSTSVFEDVNMSLSYLWREREGNKGERECSNCVHFSILVANPLQDSVHHCQKTSSDQNEHGTQDMLMSSKCPVC